MVLFACLWIGLFILASAIDLQSFLLPNWLTLPLSASGLLFNLLSDYHFCTAIDALLGLAIGYALLRLVDELYFKVRKQHGIGQGDAKLLAAIGAILGWQDIFPILFFAAILGLLCGLVMLKMRVIQFQHPIPFGPFLSLFACLFIIDNIFPFGIHP